MNYKAILKYQPWLRFININNISNRLLKYTKGDIFIVYNTISKQYELHSVTSYKLTGYSQNCVIEKEFINDYLYKDFRATELKKFMVDVSSEREMRNHIYDMNDKRHSDIMKDKLKQLERIIGTKL